MRTFLERSPGVCLRAFKTFRRYSTRFTPLIVIALLLSMLYSSLCVAIPYYLKGTKHPLLYYLLHPLLWFLLFHTCYHYYRLFAPKSASHLNEIQRNLPGKCHYCPSCDDYVIGLYDHASILGVCISLHNGRHFFALLVYSTIYCIVAAAVTVPLSVQLLWEPSLLYRICYESHLGPLSLFYCHSWNSSQSFMLYYLLSAAAALSIVVTLPIVLGMYWRFIIEGWAWSSPGNRSWLSLFDRNFVEKFLGLYDRTSWWKIISTIVIPSRFEPCDEFNR